MNGTREGSREWSLYIRSAMVPEGFCLSELVPNLFHHDEWDITMACHGDDFIPEGTAADLDRLDEIMKRHFEVKVYFLGLAIPVMEGPWSKASI